MKIGHYSKPPPLKYFYTDIARILYWSRIFIQIPLYDELDS